jgi:hypothetical protein
MDDIDLTRKGTNTSEILRLAGIKHAISNFVRILTGRPISVKFSSGQDSYTNADVVVISASTKEKSFDAVVGLALHEATHIQHKYFVDFFRSYVEHCDAMIPSPLAKEAAKLSMSIQSFGSDKTRKLSQLAVRLKFLLNILEDRRIDYWQYRNAPGYRPYYESMYDAYFRDRQIDIAMQTGEFCDGTVDDYFFHLTNMANRWFDTRALPDLDLIYGIIDLANINRFDKDDGFEYVEKKLRLDRGVGIVFELDKMPKIFQLAVRVMEIILDNAMKDVTGKQPMKQQSSGQGSDGEDGEPEDGEENLDISHGAGGFGEGVTSDRAGMNDGEADDEKSDKKQNSTPGAEGKSEEKDGEERKSKAAAEKDKKIGKINEKKLQKALARQREFLEGTTPKKNLTSAQATQMTAVEQSGASSVTVPFEASYGGLRKTQVIVMRKLTRSIMESGAFPFTYGTQMSYNYTTRSYNIQPNQKIVLRPYAPSALAVKEGFRMGAILSHRLEIRNQTQLARFNRRNTGKIDRRRLHSLGAGDDSVFYRTRITEFDPVLVHMTLDASGSMQGDKWRRTMSVAVALAVAAEKIENLDLVVSIRASIGDHAVIAIIYDSREDTPAKIKALFPYLATNGGTPEGLCFAAIMDDLLAEKHGERYFLNVSDGQPAHPEYGGELAWKHTREQINRIRGEGLKILSYYVQDRSSNADETRHAFEVMYGKDASYIDVTRVPSVVSTLNRLFLDR